MTPLEKALSEQAGEIDFCDDCENFTVVRGYAFCKVSGKLLHPLMLKVNKMCDGAGPARNCKRRKVNGGNQVLAGVYKLQDST